MNRAERIKTLLEKLNEGIYEKEEVMKLAFLSTIAGESCFMLGKPGVAKSLIARRLKLAFKDAKSFEYLMNKFSTPDEIFGPISITKLKNDKYERLVEGYLPSCEIAFLDEIWKAGPSIQNSLLTIINEKKYRNGIKEIEVPLQGLIAASNELPAKNEGLEALWDRFLIRYLVEGVEDKDSFEKLLSEDLSSEPTINEKDKITKNQYKEWQKQINKTTISETAFKVIHSIRALLEIYNKKQTNEEDKMYVSDRRWRKIAHLLKTSAFLNNRKEVDLMDCFLIEHCIWNEQEQIGIVKEIVKKAIGGHGYSLSFPTRVIKSSINELAEDIKNAKTKLVKRNVPEIYKDNENNRFYKIENCGNKCLIKKDNYESLKLNTQVGVQIFDDNDLSKSINMIVKKQGKHSISVIYQHGWKDCNIELKEITERVDKEDVIHLAIIAEWSKSKENITKKINQSFDKIEAFKKKDLKPIRANIFGDEVKVEIIETNLNNLRNDFLQLQLELEKTTSQYEE